MSRVAYGYERCGHHFQSDHDACDCPLRIEGIVRIGDVIEEWGGVSLALVIGLPRSPSGVVDNTYPHPTLNFVGPRGGERDDPFIHHIPADFAEEDMRAGHFSPADQWSVWTEASAA